MAWIKLADYVIILESAVALELAEPNVDALSSGVVVDKDSPAEVFGLGTKENEGKDFPEDDVDSSLGEERVRELPENVLNSDPNNETYSHLSKFGSYFVLF